MSKNLVEVKNGKIMCSSLDISEEFEISHSHVLEKIRNLTIDVPTVKKEFKKTEFTNNRNRKYPMFHITRRGYMSLIMNLDAKSKESKILLMRKKELFIDAFEKMEELLLKLKNNQENLEWKKSREQGKSVRLELTDNIKEFVDYATGQGSKNAKMYYANITKMQYKSLGFIQQSKPKLRDTLDLMELHQLILAEDLCKRKIKEYVLEKLHYKEIYFLVKQDIEKFADSLYLVRR